MEADFLLSLRFGCTKIILVGDPLQLPPCVLSDAGKNYGLSQSLYARIYSIFDQYPNGPISMLDTQYRMHPSICQFPSTHFYSDRLLTDKSVAKKMKHFSLKPLFLYNLTGAHQTCDDAGSSKNEDEARFIQKFCGMLIEHLAYQQTVVTTDSEEDDDSENNDNDDDDDDDDSDDGDDESSTASLSNFSKVNKNDCDSEYEDQEEGPALRPLPIDDPRSIKIQQRIAIITPYKAQVRLLRSYLPPYIEIMTVDSSQGKEKDIVIVSCVRSGGTIGFLNDMNRLNVMLTRSKNALYIVGNFNQLASQDKSWDALVKHAQRNKIICDTNEFSCDLPYC